MDVTGLGGASLNDFRMNDMLGRNNAAAAVDFAETLRRAAKSQKSEPQAPSSKFATIDKTDKLYEQCVELEIFLVKSLLSSMRNTVQKSNLIDEGFAGKMYEDMLYDEYAGDMAKNAGFGLAEMAYLDLTGQRGKVVR